MQSKNQNISLLQAGITMAWISLVAVGLVRTRTAPPPKPVDDTPVKMISVTLGEFSSPTGPSPVADVVPIPDIPVPPVTPPMIPDSPGLMAIRTAPALPSPAHVAHPAIVIHPAPQPAGPVYQQISYGTGAGNQPQPDYPREADQAGQQGTVVVRFDVDGEGNVTNVTLWKPSDWPILNVAAVRSIRETWTYPAGPPRHYQVAITYQGRQRR